MKVFLLTIALALFAVVVSGRSLPDVPNSWMGTVTIEIPFVGKVKSKYWFDYPNLRTRSEFSQFGTEAIQLDFYDEKHSYVVQKAWGQSKCEVEDLMDELFPTSLPPVAYDAGDYFIRGVNCEVWKFDMPMGLGFTWYVKRGDDARRELSTVMRTVMHTPFTDVIMDIDNMIPQTFELNDPLFDPTRYKCPKPRPPVVYNVAGYVTDASTGKVVKGATVCIQSKKKITDESGLFQFEELTEGDYEIEVSHSEYFTNKKSIHVAQNIPKGTTADIVLSKKLSSNEFKFVLTWGQTPLDLDIHMLTSSNCHVSFSNRKCSSGDLLATLDIDKRTGFGPETISTSNPGSGSHSVYVHNYSNEKPIAGCGAEVRIYNSEGILNVLKVPSSGNGRVWKIGSLTNGKFTVENVITA
ncbi:hypothetical protein RCL1_000894 [Eukaryota sp. TZLM3-RCL]